MRLPVYLLAGGRSRRFGEGDKARALLEGKPLLLHAAAQLQPFACRLVVVAEQPAKYDDLGLRTIADSGTDAGPLDGLRAALDDLQQDEGWLLLSSCDLIGLRHDWLSRLTDAAENASARAVAYRDQRWQPLPALYHRDLRSRSSAQLDAAGGALWRLLDHVDAEALPLPSGWSASIIDINTTAAMAEATARRSMS